jgi:hypothetical protein
VQRASSGCERIPMSRWLIFKRACHEQFALMLALFYPRMHTKEDEDT